MIIDFKEIPKANSSAGNQDTFELFSRDFLESLGYEVVGIPSRGADGGLDIKVKETRIGIGGKTDFYWLVSCKHFAHSKNSVSPSVEQNIYDRLVSNDCQGFIGFYSSVVSSGLKNILDGLANKISYQIFDKEKIEDSIVGISKMENLFLRYFPSSYEKWKSLYHFKEPIKLFEYYLEHEHNHFKQLFISVFGSIGNAIKQIKKHDSFKKALKDNSFDIVVEPSLFSYITKQKELEYTADYTFEPRTMVEEHIPKEIKHKYNIEIYPEPLQVLISGPKETVCILYSNNLVVDENYAKQFDNTFDELKKMLE